MEGGLVLELGKRRKNINVVIIDANDQRLAFIFQNGNRVVSDSFSVRGDFYNNPFMKTVQYIDTWLHTGADYRRKEES